MDIEIANPYVLKIMIAARPVDTISAVSKRIGVSYGWTYRWVVAMAKVGVFEKKGKAIVLNEKSPLYRRCMAFVRAAFGSDVAFRYRVVEWFGVRYCFTGTDAVFVWTDGGYNIARSRSCYPIYIKVRKSDRPVFEFCAKKLGKGAVFYKPVFAESFPVSVHNNMPVDRLEDTIAFMKKYVYNFQPALEMVQEMYGKRLGVRYKEVVTNV